MITEIPSTTETAARRSAREIVAELIEEMQRRASIHKRLFAKVWHDPEVTPADLFAELGTRAGNIMEAATSNVQAIAGLAPLFGKEFGEYLTEADYIPPLAYTTAEDGTITLTTPEE